MSDECEGCEDRIDSMQYEITTLEEDLGGARDRIEALEDELTAAQKDAERYRWMKANVTRIPMGWFQVGWDAAIDAAIAAEKSTKGE